MDAFLLSYIGFPLDFFKNEKKMGLDLIQKYFSGFTTQQIDQLSKMEGLYKDWNSKINVISRKDIDNLYPNHILHSLSISAFMSFSRSEEHTSELQSRGHLVCRLLLEKKKRPHISNAA